MKNCSKCKNPKSKEDFGLSKTSKDGLRSRCKSCDSFYSQEYKIRKRLGLKSLKDSREKIHGDLVYNSKEYRASTSLKKYYGITLQQYDELYKEQSGLCKICGKSQGYRRFDVDHCHKTGKIRGLLCNHCNQGIGHFFDSKDLLIKAANYLIK